MTIHDICVAQTGRQAGRQTVYLPGSFAETKGSPSGGGGALSSRVQGRWRRCEEEKTSPGAGLLVCWYDTCCVMCRGVIVCKVCGCMVCDGVWSDLIFSDLTRNGMTIASCRITISYGVTWCDVLWCDVVLYSVVWYDVLACSSALLYPRTL